MTGKRKRYSAELKAKVALEALRGERTVAELGTKHGVRPTMITAWKKEGVEGGAGGFSGKAEATKGVREGEIEKLHAKIGQLVERIFVESLRSMSLDRRRHTIDPQHLRLSIQRQCRLVSISRSAFYHQPVGETPLNLELMRLLDAQFLATPWYGSRQMARCLRQQGYTVGRNRVRRLMAKMGLAAIYQALRKTVPQEQKTHKYLLRDLVIDRPNQVWCADITYIPCGAASCTWSR